VIIGPKRKWQQKYGENYIMRRFIICRPPSAPHIIKDYQIKDDEMHEAH
jgi:nitrate reductase cytochrome c-type subunit